MKGVVLFNAGVLVQRTQRFGRNPHALLAPVFINHRNVDQVRLPLALGVALRVRHIVPRLSPLTGDWTYLRHIVSSADLPLLQLFLGKYCTHAYVHSLPRVARAVGRDFPRMRVYRCAVLVSSSTGAIKAGGPYCFR
jgi:hypothetical protein